MAISFAGVLLIQTSFVQTYITGIVTEKLSQDLFEADIRIEKVHFKPFNTLVLKNTSVLDKSPVRVDTTGMPDSACMKFRNIGTGPVDTLFRAEYIIARFSLKNLLKKDGLEIGKAYISNGSFNLVIEDNEYGTNLNRMFRLLPKTEKKKPQDKDIFMIKRVELDNFRYTMKNYEEDSPLCPESGINWNDMDVTEIDLKAKDLKMRGNVMSGTAESLSFKEKSGYICRHISGRAEVGNGKTLVNDLTVSDPWSHISLEKYNMYYDSEKDFQDYVNKVRMEGVIRQADVDFRTLWFFAPELKGNRLRLKAKGSMTGPVERMTFKDMMFTMPDGMFRGTVNGTLSNVTAGAGMEADLKVDSLTFTGTGLDSFIAFWNDGGKPGLGKYMGKAAFRMEAGLKGRLDSLGVEASISSDIGRIGADIALTGIGTAENADIGIKGGIRTYDLNLNKAMAGIPVNECSISTVLDARLGEKTTVDIDTLFIDRLNFNGYDYHSIAAAGSAGENRLEGKIICHDPNLNFMLQGIYTLSPKTGNTICRLYANVGYADLNAINIDKRDVSRISFRTGADFSQIDGQDMFGSIEVSGLMLENSTGKYDIGDISVSSRSAEGLYNIKLSSSFAEGAYSGTGFIPEFIEDLSFLSIKKELPAIFEGKSEEWSGNSYDLSFRTLNTMDLMSFIAPGVYIAEDSRIDVTIRPDGDMKGSMKSQRIAFNEQYMKDVDCSFDNSEGNIGGEINSESISIATLLMKNNSFKVFADDNHFGLGFTYDNQNERINRGEVFLVGDVDRDDDGKLSYGFRLLPSSVYLNAREWNIYQSDVRIEGEDIKVEHLEFRSAEQSVLASGGFSTSHTDTLDINLDRFDISLLNPLIGQDLALKGDLTGSVKLLSPFDEKGLLMDFSCDSTSLAGEKIGNLRIRSKWDERYRRLDISLADNLDGRSSFIITGNYSPSLKRLDMKAELDGMKINFVQPFLTDVFSEMSGGISGEITAEGPIDNLNISGRGTRLDNAGLRIAYTNVKYIADGKFGIDSYGVYFNDISISDRYGNRGNITGKIGYDHFRNIHFDTRINVNRIEAIDLNEKQAVEIYGHLFATGSVNITGPMNSIMLTADASTAGAGQLHIPMTSSVNAGAHNLLRFKEPEIYTETDPYEEMMSRLKKNKAMASDLGLKLRINAAPEVEAFIEIDKESGNVLTARGSGLIDLDIRPNKEIFDIKGDYTLSGGNYRFVALGLATRDFAINEGSSIKFNGDIMESTLDIDAIYKTKASLSTLIADTTSVSNRRLVECGIRITDQLSDPRLSFSINIPDLDPVIKSRVGSALSTEDKVQKQFLSLIISNNFLPDEQSGIVNNSSVLFSNVTEMMANQINNIFQKLDIPLDLGLSYQPNESGSDIFDVAVSTQLFNNRVIVNGNIGNRQYNQGSGQSDVVGDLDIEIKLDRPGAFRLNLFSHSADQYTNYLDDSQRNGVGLTYQQEFDHFGQFFRKMFIGRKKREEMELEEIRSKLNEEKVHIRITPEDYNNKRSSRRQR